jgi:Domain of unknown function (DUF5666)
MKHMKNLMITLSAFSLAACGSSGDTTTDLGQGNVTNPIVAPVTTKTTVGTVDSVSSTAFKVQDQSFNLSSSTISYAKQNLPSSVLTSGFNIRVTSNSSGQHKVELNPDLAGFVSAVQGDKVQINGQSLQLSKHSLVAGDFVLISLNPLKSNEATAFTKLSSAETPLYIELEGQISELNEATQRFSVLGQQVDYSAAMIEDGPVASGRWAEVYGQLSNGVLKASEVDFEQFPDSAESEISGVISWVNDSRTSFELNQRYNFNISTATRFEQGSVQDLQPGRFVEVTLNQQNNQSVLTEVEFKNQNISNTGSQRVEVTGTMAFDGTNLQLNGFSFAVNSLTELEDGLTLQTLDGQYLQIEAVQRADGSIAVKEIERARVSERIELTGLLHNNSIWGYQAADNSLNSFSNQWLELDCSFDGVRLSACTLDD